MLQDDRSNMDNVEEDSLEDELGRYKERNDMSDFSESPSETQNDESEEEDFMRDEGPTYDNTVDINYFEASGTYSLDLIRQRRVLRHEKSAAVNHLDLPEAMESTLMAHIDLSEFHMIHAHINLIILYGNQHDFFSNSVCFKKLVKKCTK